jgi:transcriptional regulator with XRE-family HTH domain
MIDHPRFQMATSEGVDPWHVDPVDVGRRLLAVMYERGLTRHHGRSTTGIRELARRCAKFGYPVSFPELSKLTKGVRKRKEGDVTIERPINPKLNVLLAVCRALNIRLEWLLFGTPPRDEFGFVSPSGGRTDEGPGGDETTHAPLESYISELNPAKKRVM